MGAVAGTLGVTGATTLSSTLDVTGGITVNTNKFTVVASNGNTAVAGTLGVTGDATFSGQAIVDNGGTLPASCTIGAIFVDTTGSSERFCACTATNTFKCTTIS